MPILEYDTYKQKLGAMEPALNNLAEALDLKDAQAKIDYLKELKAIAAASADRAGFKAAVQERYPRYSGENYLDMTAGFFFA